MAKATRFDVSRAHSLRVKVASLREDYLDMSEEFREFLDEHFEAENQFLNLLAKLEITADDIANIAEENRERIPRMDCCSLPVDIF